MVLNVAFAKRSRWNNWNLVGRISASAIRRYFRATDCRMAASPYPAYQNASTATLILLSRKISQRWGCVPAEIGEPKRE